MNKAGFESRLRKRGYENIGQREMAADVVNEAHTHDFDAQVLVVDGEITITRDGKAHTFRKGDTCEVPAGTVHAEQVGPEGVRYIAGRRQAAAPG
jgi:quercetin dioxygenase-like cupin family protein